MKQFWNNCTTRIKKGARKLWDSTVDAFFYIMFILFCNPIIWIVYVAIGAFIIAIATTQYQNHMMTKHITVKDRIYGNQTAYILSDTESGNEMMFKIESLFQRPELTKERMNYIFLKCAQGQKLIVTYVSDGQDYYIVDVKEEVKK